MALKVIYGDLIKLAQAGQLDVIVHGCNCFNNMGSGLAPHIRQAFPKAWEVDQATSKGCPGKLGNYTHAICGDVIVVNAYTQYGYGPNGKTAEQVRLGINRGGRKDHFDYTGFREILRQLRSQWGGLRFGFPLIGAGLAGGNWERIQEIITAELVGEDVTIVKFQKE